MIRFAIDSIFADTEEEKLQFYDRICAGDPIVFGQIAIWEQKRKLLLDNEAQKE